MAEPGFSDPSFAAPAPIAPVAPGPRPTFSVIIAAWQAADTIAAAVGSALAQTQPPLEIVVADDGSTDDLPGALASFGDAVQVLRLPHGGVGRATNAAAAAATGDFVVVLDADDAWHPRRLERLGDLAAVRPDLDLLTTDAWFVVDGRRRGRFYDHNRFEVDDQPREILRRTFFFAHVAARRSRWVEVGGFATDLHRACDWDFQLRMLLTGSRAGCVLEPLADYTIHGSSLSANRHESLLERVELLEHAAATHRLGPEELAVLRQAQDTYRRRAIYARAEHALITGGPGRRRAAFELARAGRGSRTRLLAGAAALAPGWAGRRLREDAAARGYRRSDRVIGAGPSVPDGDDEQAAGRAPGDAVALESDSAGHQGQ